MSGGFYDPFGTRQASKVIKSSQELQNDQDYADYQLQATEGQFRVPTPQQMAANMYAPIIYDAFHSAQDAGTPVNEQTWTDLRTNFANAVNSGNPGVAANALGGQANYDQWNAWNNGGYQAANNIAQQNIKPIEDARAAAAAAFKKQQQERAQNQAIQQNAYSNQLGGGATGGVINNWNGLAGGSATSTVQPGTAPPTSAGAWNSPGLFGANGFQGGSNAPATTPQTWSSTGQATQAPVSNLGWGGVFTSKNPWSMA